jgi:hypothetical protein
MRCAASVVTHGEALCCRLWVQNPQDHADRFINHFMKGSIMATLSVEPKDIQMVAKDLCESSESDRLIPYGQIPFVLLSW